MTENKINPLLEAMSDIDDNIITNTKKTKNHPLLIVAVAAAALAMIMGAAVVSRSYVTVNNKHLLDYDFTVQENVNTDPHEQLLEMGATSIDYSEGQIYELTARPSEVFEVLNIRPLMNDCFTDEATEITVTFDKFRDYVKPGYLFVWYTLTDKKTNVEIRFTMVCKLIKEAELIDGYKDIEEYELLDLNNGSKVMFFAEDAPWWSQNKSMWSGSFCYGGIIYSFHTDFAEYDAFVQTLDDLGIL